MKMASRSQRSLSCIELLLHWGTVLTDVTKQPFARWIVAIVAVVWLLGGNAEHVWRVGVPLDLAHGSITSSGGPLAVNADHTQCDAGLSAPCPEATAVVSLPRTVANFLTLGVFVTVAAAVSYLASLTVERGPPRGSARVVSGQDLLTWFCLARR